MRRFNIIRFSLIIISSLLLSTTFFSCRSMEDNYAQYKEPRIYAATVKNIQVENGFQRVTLRWENPAVESMDYIEIRYEDQLVETQGMVEEITFENLQVKGYTFTLRTVDSYGNTSIPQSVYAFPNGEGTE